MNEEKILDDINFCLEGEYITLEHYEVIQGLLDLYRSKTEQLETALNSLKKEKEKNKKLKEIEAIVDTTPYVAYTSYGDILYESDEILEIIRSDGDE